MDLEVFKNELTKSITKLLGEVKDGSSVEDLIAAYSIATLTDVLKAVSIAEAAFLTKKTEGADGPTRDTG